MPCSSDALLGARARGARNFTQRRPGGLAVKLDLVGYNITSDNEGCGTNSMRVWVTVLIEDDDRDDADGPSYTNVGPDACIGVKQL